MNNEIIKVLLIEDNPGDARLIKEMLNDSDNFNFELKCVDRLSAGLECLNKRNINLILLDIFLPDSSGLNTIERIIAKSAGIPVVIITGIEDETLAIESLKKGIQDYLIKGRMNSVSLIRCLNYALERHRLVSELEKYNEELSASELRLREVIEKNSDAIVIVNSDGIINFVNPTAESLFRRKSLELIGEQFGFPIVTGNPAEVEIFLGSGEMRIAEMQMVEIKWEGDIAYVASLRDITERKKMEQMLIQSEKMASIGVLAAGVAHEINNPMGYVYSNLKTIKKYNEKIKNFYYSLQDLSNKYSNIDKNTGNAFTEKYIKLKEEVNIDFILNDMSEAVEESIEGAEKVNSIVYDLKDFAREEKSKMEAANINDGIEKTLNVIWNELKYKAEVVKEFGDIPEIRCDIRRLNQVFMNIIVNAVQAIENHGIIKVKTYGSDDSVIIQISDTGKGISKENINKIFDAFFTTKEPGKGTGLGLSISYKIIEGHNGKIKVESEVGKGTTFTIKLPVQITEAV